ncbi:MAG: hypothetical protein JXN61_04500 [Sedimentisphaerales bacterium]|nr:hypothetical protein [Sedimentisphaerales bacterium]
MSFSDQQVGISSFPPLSNGRLLFVRLQREGDRIELAIPPSVKPGRYTFSARLVTSWNYGVIRLALNDTHLADTVDTYAPVINAKTVELGTVDIRPEANTLTLEAVARNPKSTGYYLGIDALMLAPARSRPPD